MKTGNTRRELTLLLALTGCGGASDSGIDATMSPLPGGLFFANL